ncbi:hypothetical protein SAMN05421770_101409 [Granulicella rosea]|uniref:Uncharacterized protein n=1 Tax=Granulicella rosea TaxID=474952 RepID=A0A239DEC9_9BACT|nr:hypothetical protein [Granulicella rosea]SNS30258.1 hypothetical protein SAMN05421770_101409 [Granulicella rosea]
MKMTTRTKLTTAVAALAMTLPTVAAHAEKKPTVLLVHSAAQADADWKNLSLELASEGYRVLAMKVLPNQSAADERAELTQFIGNEDANSRFLVVTSEPAGATVSDFAGTLGNRVKSVVYLTTAPTVAAVSATPQYFVQLTAAKTQPVETSELRYSVHAAGPQMVASTSDLVGVIEAVDAKKSQAGSFSATHPATSLAATTKVAAHSATSLK